MYNPILDTFITVADYGSFTKASEVLFISPTAIMKQINTLEKQLDIKLFNRNASGVSLTSGGNLIYTEAKYIIDYSKKVMTKAKALSFTHDNTLCVGTSLLNPAKPFMDLWYKVNKNFPNYKLHLVPFDDNHKDILKIINSLGEKFDFLIGVCDSKTWLNLCNFLPLGNYKKMIAVSRDHKLAHKKSINIEDLYGETLIMVKSGDSAINDIIRKDLQKNHPQIHIEEGPQFYDLSVFSYCAESNKILLTIECWKDVHPGLVSIPVNWNYKIPYGILYSLNPPKDILNFIDIVKNKLSFF